MRSLNAENLDLNKIRQIIEIALEEDIGTGDVTTNSLVSGSEPVTARVLAREDVVVSGGILAAPIFECMGTKVGVVQLIDDGRKADAGSSIIELSGPACSILSAERLLLNFMQRLSGIAKSPALYVAAANNNEVMILDTRKTTPGMRYLEKYAVLCGGGYNHRFGLHDMAMIKDNHRQFWASHGANGLAGAVRAVRDKYPGIAVELEIDSEDEIGAAIEARPDWILLDNMDATTLRRCVERIDGRCKAEASGGITIEKIADIAATGVDAISVGALTHSAPAVDIGLDFV